MPGRPPTNPVALNLQLLPDATRYVVTPEVEKNMEFHRQLVRGQGFYQSLVRSAPAQPTSPTRQTFTVDSLKEINLLDFDGKIVEALLAEVLEHDQYRFWAYMSARPIGLGLITAVSF